MILFDLPLEPDADGRYILLRNHDVTLPFATHRDALAHAVAEAAQRTALGLPTAINVEGGDGIWRLIHP